MMREGWTYKKLGEVAHSELGKTINSSKDKGVLYPYLCAVNVLWDNIDTSTLKETKFEESEIERYSVKKGDLLICEGGDIGRAAIWDREQSILYQNALHRVRFHETLLPRFCLLYLLCLKQRGIIDGRYGKGVTIKHLVQSSLLSIPIPVPPLSEQVRIVSELDLLSGIIEKKKAQLKEYDKLAQSIFYDMFGDPVTNEKGWEVKKLGEVCEYAKTRVRSESITTYNYVGVDNLLQNCQGKTMATKVPDSLGLTEYWQGDVLIGNIRPYLKKIWLATEKGGCNGDVLAIRRKEEFGETINTMFLLKCLSTDRFFDFAMQFAKGEKMPRGDKKEIMKFIIPLPPLPLQQSFASKIEAIERQKALIQQSITETETLFNSRMDYYFD